MKRSIRILGSVWFAVFLLGGLLSLLTFSTLFESRYGTPAAQKAFYTTPWFDAFLGLFWINIFCATLKRLPFRRKHTGFILTHIGILTLLIGAFVARLGSVEGQMTLFEGEKWNRIRLEGYEIQAHLPDKPTYVYSLAPKDYRRRLNLQIPERGWSMRFLGLSEKKIARTHVREGGLSKNVALQVALKSAKAGLDQSFWLTAHDPKNPFSNELDLGPARLSLVPHESQKVSPTPQLWLYRDETQIAAVDLSASNPLPISIDDGLQITALRYLPSAKVSGKTLMNDTEGHPFNPAVELTLQDDKGQTEQHTKFFLFPDFESLHGKAAQSVLGLKVVLDVPTPESGPGAKPSVTFFEGADQKWSFATAGKNGAQAPQTLEAGREYPAGWMDFSFTVSKIYDHAYTENKIEDALDGETGRAGALLEIQSPNHPETRTEWLFADTPLVLGDKEKSVTFSLEPLSHPVPFTLELKDFRKVDYPGTQKPASFESDVALSDPSTQTRIETTISMNRPLDRGGFRVFQSSYLTDPEFGEGSVFTIAKNPGIGLIYAGGIVLLIGVICLLYVRPFSSVLT